MKSKPKVTLIEFSTKQTKKSSNVSFRVSNSNKDLWFVYYNNIEVGSLNLKTQTYVKQVLRSEHYFKIFSGYGISLDVINAIKNKVNKVLILEMDTNNNYVVPLSEYIDSEDRWNHEGDLQCIAKIE